jgi:nucleotide-binding universal stress UspA family protein
VFSKANRELEEQRATRALAGAEASFRSIAGSRTHLEWRQTYGFATEFAIQQSRAAALIVASRPVPGEKLGTMSVNGGDLVMSAGRPVLFVPPGVEHLSAQRVIVAWKDTREARRAVTDALPFIRLAQAATVVCVGDDSGSEDARGYLADHDVLVSKTSLPDSATSPAEALLRFAEQEAADLIVCGAYGHSRTREWVFGGVTRNLLNHAGICCLMTH